MKKFMTANTTEKVNPYKLGDLVVLTYVPYERLHTEGDIATVVDIVNSHVVGVTVDGEPYGPIGTVGWGYEIAWIEKV